MVKAQVNAFLILLSCLTVGMADDTGTHSVNTTEINPTLRTITSGAVTNQSAKISFNVADFPNLFKPIKPVRWYPAHVEKVYDGDTCTANIDLGFGVTLREGVRLDGIDTPELPTLEGKKAGRALAVMVLGKDVILEVGKPEREKFGRVLATVWLGTTNVNRLLIEKGFAVEYHGGKRGEPVSEPKAPKKPKTRKAPDGVNTITEHEDGTETQTLIYKVPDTASETAWWKFLYNEAVKKQVETSSNQVGIPIVITTPPPVEL